MQGKCNASRPRARLAVLASLAAAGCSGVGLGGLAPYGPANVVMPAGYSHAIVGERHYQVRATGTSSTPRERIEKIALARAAELGVEQKFAFFKVAGVQHEVACKEKKLNTKIGDMPAAARPTVLVDVFYSKTPDDPEYRSTADSFTQLRAELDAESLTPEAAAANAAQSRAACGSG